MENGLIGWLHSMITDVQLLFSAVAVAGALGSTIWTVVTSRRLPAPVGSAIVAAFSVWLVDSMGITGIAGLFEGTFTQSACRSTSRSVGPTRWPAAFRSCPASCM